MVGEYSKYSDRKVKLGEYLNKNVDWSVNLQVEYMINPIWGVMLEYMYSAQNKKGLNLMNEIKTMPKYSIATDRDLQMHEFNGMVVFNVLNLVDRYRYRTDWNFFVGLGAGIMRYEKCRNDKYSFRTAATIPAMMSVEYSPIPALGIFAESQFRWYSKDDINTVKNGMHDISLYAGLGIRYHIITNNEPHVHVISVDTYKPYKANVRDDEKDDKIDELQSKINFLTEQMNKANTDIANLEKKHDMDMKQAEAEKIQNVEKPVSDVNNQNITNIYTTNNNIYQYNSEDNGIYFDYRSSAIKSMYYKDILKIAQRMSNDYKLKVKLTGYCDSQGSESYNKELAQKRIDAIIYVLVNRYRIARDRFITENIGKTDSENEVDELNRRVDIEYLY
ncbi:MAG: OmpA family protein [Paludibacteraceae bacterium]|nr:OmpA family protein [Paludibacteraceae bacterium]